eukprot:590029-Prorocentrum_minimum.AAC.1
MESEAIFISQFRESAAGLTDWSDAIIGYRHEEEEVVNELPAQGVPESLMPENRRWAGCAYIYTYIYICPSSRRTRPSSGQVTSLIGAPTPPRTDQRLKHLNSPLGRLISPSDGRFTRRARLEVDLLGRSREFVPWAVDSPLGRSIHPSQVTFGAFTCDCTHIKHLLAEGARAHAECLLRVVAKEVEELSRALLTQLNDLHAALQRKPESLSQGIFPLDARGWSAL